MLLPPESPLCEGGLFYSAAGGGAQASKTAGSTVRFLTPTMSGFEMTGGMLLGFKSHCSAAERSVRTRKQGGKLSDPPDFGRGVLSAPACVRFARASASGGQGARVPFLGGTPSLGTQRRGTKTVLLPGCRITCGMTDMLLPPESPLCEGGLFYIVALQKNGGHTQRANHTTISYRLFKNARMQGARSHEE